MVVLANYSADYEASFTVAEGGLLGEPASLPSPPCIFVNSRLQRLQDLKLPMR